MKTRCSERGSGHSWIKYSLFGGAALVASFVIYKKLTSTNQHRP